MLVVENLLKVTRIGLQDEGVRGNQPNVLDKPDLKGLKEAVICPALSFEDPSVRKKAITCLGIYSLMDEV